MTRARGVSQTPRDMRHAARYFLDRTETKTQNINESNIRFKIIKSTLKHQKPWARANKLQYKIKEK